MGGRGSASGAGGYSIAKSVMGFKGNTIDLSDNPLKYGRTDASISGGARYTIEGFESVRSKNKIEYSVFVDADGRIIGKENRGGKGSVSATYKQRSTAYAMSHNHPRAENPDILGGTFSVGDIKNFVGYGQQVYRAAAAEGTYSISKGKNFNDVGFLHYYQTENTRARKVYEAIVKDAKAKYSARTSEIARKYGYGRDATEKVNEAYNDLKKANDKAFNAMLVDNHNALLRGQKQYGYKYTLERRG